METNWPTYDAAQLRAFGIRKVQRIAASLGVVNAYRKHKAECIELILAKQAQ